MPTDHQAALHAHRIGLGRDRQLDPRDREFAELFEEAGFPPGVFNVVTGFGADVGTPLVEHPLVSKISFTGSDTTGRIINEKAARHFKHTAMELGGKSPNVVFEDADLEQAVFGAIAGIFAATGQTCIAYQGAALAVLMPGSAEEVAALVKACASLNVAIVPKSAYSPRIVTNAKKGKLALVSSENMLRSRVARVQRHRIAQMRASSASSSTAMGASST